MSTTEQDMLLTAEQAAARLAIAQSTLARWRREGAGPMYARVGRTVRYRNSTVESWLLARTFDSRAAEAAARHPAP
jgi:excisionase family DNA binding protein